MVFCFKTRLKLFVLWIKLLLMGMIVLFFSWFIIQPIKPLLFSSTIWLATIWSLFFSPPFLDTP